MIVLDTHALMWLAAEPDLLSPRASNLITAKEAELAFSTASIQELAYLAVRGRVTVDRSIRRWIVDALRVHQVQVLPSTFSIALRAGSLDPSGFHGDPVDRLIYATAVEHDAQLVTADRRLREVDPARVIW